MSANVTILGDSDSGEANILPSDFVPIIVTSGATKGMLLQCKHDFVRYSIYEGGDNDVVAENNDISVMVGYGVTSYPLNAQVQFNRAFDGRIHYEVFE